MNLIFKGQQIILPNGSPVKFAGFIRDGNKKVGWLDEDGNRWEMRDLVRPEHYNKIIRKIQKIRPLNDEEIDSIRWMLGFHECEPSAAAERISKELGCDYQTIFNLL